MLLGLIVLMLVFLNIGGLSSALMSFGRGDVLGGLGAVLGMVLFDMLGFWLLRELRENG